MTLPSDTLTELYTADPGDFLTVRKALADAAKQSGDLDLAGQITAARKPTVAAWVVNRIAHADPSVVDRLLDLGARLRSAHEALDATALRDLSAERRQLVSELSTTALTNAGRPDPGAALRDEVHDTLDAAVADPRIAARLGALTRAERWSGFGVALDAPAGAPELTVIRGGRDRTAARTRNGTAKVVTPAAPGAGLPADAPRTTEQRTRDRARTRAREKAREKAGRAFDAAEAALQAGEQAEHSAGERVRELDAQLTRLQSDLVAAKRAHDRSRQEVRSARNRRREARAALDRADRVDRVDP